MPTTKLWGNDWVEIREIVEPEQGVKGYTFLHETRCKGSIVALLPFLYDTANRVAKILARSEVTPCWGMKPVLSSIAGGVENDDPTGTAIMELREEAGLIAAPKELLWLGTCRGTKSCDTTYFLYAVNAEGLKKVEATGDGSHLESIATCKWIGRDELIQVQDPIFAMMLLRLGLQH